MGKCSRQVNWSFWQSALTSITCAISLKYLPDEIIYDPEIWLDPLEKGTLYHTIFERFYKAISQKNEKPNRERHNELILKIAESTINEFKEKIPPPNEIVFDIEKREIVESCLIFIAERKKTPAVECRLNLS